MASGAAKEFDLLDISHNRLRADAAATTMPVHWIASENDLQAPIESARALFDALGSRRKQMLELPGARLMSVGELQGQLEWLVERLDVDGGPEEGTTV